MDHTKRNRRFIAHKTIDGMSLQDIYELLVEQLTDTFKRDLCLFYENVEILEGHKYTEEEINEYLNNKPVVVLDRQRED